MGGEDHGSIRAAVLEQMADAHLSRVDDFSSQGKIDKCPIYFSELTM